MIGERLRIARKAKKYSQEELAKLINTGKTTVSNYETGYSRPSPEIMNDLADILGVTTDYLYGRTENPNGTAKDSVLDDPELGLWFREGKKASSEARQKALDFLRYIQEQEKGRKPGDKQ